MSDNCIYCWMYCIMDVSIARRYYICIAKKNNKKWHTILEFELDSYKS